MINLEDFKDELLAEFDAMTEEDWDRFFNPPPKPREPCIYCKDVGPVFCGPCMICENPGHIQSIMFFTGCYCEECYKKEVERINNEQFGDYNNL